MKFSTKLALASVSMISLATSAYAQDAKADANADIVVTGTLIRGTQVTGSQVIGVSSDAIVQQGANSTNQLLGMIPQIANNFNGRTENDPRGAKAITISRPNLRNMPGLTSSSGAVTLVLVDGQRLTGVGVKESAVDPDVVPAAVLAGVDVVTDGGSSLYGADAVAGVINFRTLKSFEGIKLDANYGMGTTLKHYSQWDAAITAGTKWATGNAYVSAGYSTRDFVANSETTWANGVRYSATDATSLSGTQCASPVGTETRWKHYAAGNANFWTSNPLASGAGTFPVGNPCDTIAAGTYLPKQARKNVFASLTQELADNIDLHVTAYWTQRKTELFDYPLGFTSAGSTITTGAQVGAIYGDPAANTIVAIPGGIGFSFGPNAAYVNRPQTLGFTTWGITPELTMKLKGDWQLRTSVHYGRSINAEHWNEVNGVKAQCYITGCTGVAAGQLNPLSVATASASVITDILNWETAQDTLQTKFTFRSIADGTLFELPGGAAKLAVGVEHQSDAVKTRLGLQARGALASAPYLSNERTSNSAFAEISLPLTTFADVSGSLRYDHYSDFGNTTNPNLGINLKPTNWLTVFGHWNKSFNAPTPLDNIPVALGRVGGIVYTNVTNPTTGAYTNGPTDPLHLWNGTGTKSIVLEGPNIGLKPQTANSWAVGFEAKPLDGLRFGGEFYSIDFKNILAAVDVVNQQTYIDFPQYYYFQTNVAGANAITSATYNSLMGQLANGAALSAQVPLSDAAVIVDRRTSNVNTAKLRGVDFHIYYDTEISLGHLALGLSGTKATKAQIAQGTIVQNNLGLISPAFTASAFAGLNAGPISTKLTVNYSGAFKDGSPDNVGTANPRVSPFVTANLFLGYNFADEGALKGTSLRLTVDNVLNEKPQYIKRGAGSFGLSYANWTLGRVIKFGISKKY